MSMTIMNIRKQADFIARARGGSVGREDARSRRSVALRLLLRRPRFRVKVGLVALGHLSFNNKNN